MPHEVIQAIQLRRSFVAHEKEATASGCLFRIEVTPRGFEPRFPG